MLTSLCTVTSVASNVPSYGGSVMLNPYCHPIWSDLYDLIEATLNLGVVATATSLCDGDPLCGAFATPNETGRATTANPAALSSSLLRKSSLRAPRSVMIRKIRFLRSAPVTPDTQASGDSTQNSQAFRMLSA